MHGRIPLFPVERSYYDLSPPLPAQVLKLVSLPVWHSLSPGRLQLELAAQPGLAKRWKALLKKEAKAAKAAAAAAAAKDTPETAAAAAAAELPKAEATFLPGMLQEFLKCLRVADGLLTGQHQQQQQQAAAVAAAAAAAAEGESESDEEEEEQQQQGDGDDSVAAVAADGVTANGHHANGPTASTAAGGQQQQQQRGKKRGRGRGGGGGGGGGRGPRRLGKRVLLHLERFVEFLIDLLSQLPTRRFVHALVEDQQLLVKVGEGCVGVCVGGGGGGRRVEWMEVRCGATQCLGGGVEDQQLLVKVGRGWGWKEVVVG